MRINDEVFIDDTDPPQLCSFCGWSCKNDAAGQVMIHHVGVNICSKCVAQCNQVLNCRGWFLPGDVEYLSWFSQSIEDYDGKYEGLYSNPDIHFTERLRANLTAAQTRIAALEQALATCDAALEKIETAANQGRDDAIDDRGLPIDLGDAFKFEGVAEIAREARRAAKEATG